MKNSHFRRFSLTVLGAASLCMLDTSYAMAIGSQPGSDTEEAETPSPGKPLSRPASPVLARGDATNSQAAVTTLEPVVILMDDLSPQKEDHFGAMPSYSPLDADTLEPDIDTLRFQMTLVVEDTQVPSPGTAADEAISNSPPISPAPPSSPDVTAQETADEDAGFDVIRTREELEEELTKMQARKTAVEQEVREATIQLAVLQAQIQQEQQAWSSQKETATGRFEEYKQQQQQKISALKQQVQAQEAEIVKLKSKIAPLETQVRQLQEENRTQKDALSHRTAEMERLEEENATLRLAHGPLKESLAERTAELERIRGEAKAQKQAFEQHLQELIQKAAQGKGTPQEKLKRLETALASILERFQRA